MYFFYRIISIILKRKDGGLMKTKVKKKTKKNNLGFSLVEVLLAVVLLAIVMVPLMQAVLSSMSINAKSRKLMAATDLAQTIIENCEGMIHDEIQTLLCHNGYHAVSLPFLKLHDSGDFYKSYTASGSSLGTLNLSQSESASFSSFNTSPYDTRCLYNAAQDAYYLSNVEYTDGKFFDVVIKMSLAPNSNSSDKYHIYTVSVTVYDTDFKSTTPHSKDNKIVTLNGSTFNQFEF